MDTTPAYLPWHPDHARDPSIRLSDQHESITGAGFAARVDAAAAHLLRLGVGAGDVVATFLPNRIDLLTAICAAWRIGAAATPVNPTFTPDETAHQIADSGARLVVVPDAIAGDADGNARRFPGAATLAASRIAECTPADAAPPRAGVDPSATALVIYTSGSTGRPKGVILDHANIDAMSAAMAEVVDMGPGEHALMPLPLFHSNALLASFLAPFRVGGRLTILDRFDPASFARAVAEHRPTFFSAVPAIYGYLLALPEGTDVDFSSLRFAICGAAPASADMLRAFEDRFGVRVLTGYGLTEGTCVSTVMRPGDEPRAGSVGRALPGQEVRIGDGAGGFAPPGTAGEVLVRGANVMRGYLHRPEATADAVVDGWLRTGDIGILDDDGYLTLVDRMKDIIIRGGENLYPSEIESALNSNDAVHEAAVVGAPHPVLNEVPVAYVTARPGSAPDPDDLHRHLRGRLAKVKWPVAITVLDDLPRNPVGKVDKPTLRAMAGGA